MVSGFHPNNLSDDREAAHTLARDLESKRIEHRPWGAISSLIVAFLSFGAVPALLWHDRFRDFVGEERKRLRRFAEWMRAHSDRPETMDLRVAAEDLGVRPLLSALSIASVIGVIIFFVFELNSAGGGHNFIHRIANLTYKFEWRDVSWQAPLPQPQRLFLAWSVGLSVSYLFHWLQVQSHAADVRRFARHANSIFRSAGVPRVPVPAVGIRLTKFWVLAAVLLATKGAWWGIAMMISGAAQQHYMAAESLRLRRALAARVREMARLPSSDLSTASERLNDVGVRRCPHVRCLAAVPQSARFCPRCGHNLAAQQVDETGA